MAAMLRLNGEEQERLDRLAETVNLRRLSAKQKPLADSKLLHELIDMALDSAQLTEHGELYLDWEDRDSVKMKTVCRALNIPFEESNKDYRKLGKRLISKLPLLEHIPLYFQQPTKFCRVVFNDVRPA